MPQCRFLLTLICVDVAEKVGMTTKEILRATATTLFQFHSRGNTALVYPRGWVNDVVQDGICKH